MFEVLDIVWLLTHETSKVCCGEDGHVPLTHVRRLSSRATISLGPADGTSTKYQVVGVPAPIHMELLRYSHFLSLRNVFFFHGLFIYTYYTVSLAVLSIVLSDTSAASWLREEGFVAFLSLQIRHQTDHWLRSTLPLS